LSPRKKVAKKKLVAEYLSLKVSVLANFVLADKYKATKNGYECLVLLHFAKHSGVGFSAIFLRILSNFL